MKGRDFFKRAYAKGYTPWSEAGRVDELTEEFLDLIKREVPIGRVLDIGCGEGRIARAFSRSGFNACGIDYVMEAVVKASERAGRESVDSRCSFLIGDVLSWPFRSGVFDIAIDNGCFHHVVRRDWSEYLKGLLRVTKHRAFFMLTVFTCGDRHAQRGERSWIWHRGHYDHFFTLEELKRIFGKWFEFIRIEESRDEEYAFYHLLLRRF